MEEQNKSQIFRKSSLESISSPEQLSDYLKVTNPGVWIILAAIIIFLIGLFAWSTIGKLEMALAGIAEVKNGTAQIVLTDRNYAELESGMTVRIENQECRISEIKEDTYGRMIAYAHITVTDGIYDVEIITESISPIQFLF
jgi:hypothetical protein